MKITSIGIDLAKNVFIRLRQPASGLTLHSDRGSQYASAEYRTLLAPARHRLQHESPCKLLGQFRDGAVLFESEDGARLATRVCKHAEADRDLIDYIVGFYNCPRLHSTLGYLSPHLSGKIQKNLKSCLF